MRAKKIHAAIVAGFMSVWVASSAMALIQERMSYDLDQDPIDETTSGAAPDQKGDADTLGNGVVFFGGAFDETCFDDMFNATGCH